MFDHVTCAVHSEPRKRINTAHISAFHFIRKKKKKKKKNKNKIKVCVSPLGDEIDTHTRGRLET